MNPLSNKLNFVSVLGLFSILFFKGVFCLVFTPPWQAPDEVTHAEASLLHASTFRPAANGVQQLELQQRILSSLRQFDFYRYVQVPEPMMDPISFKSTPFLEAAPSKMGRPLLYYWLSGTLSLMDMTHPLHSLYRLRLFNLSLLILSFGILFRVLTIQFPKGKIPIFTGLFFLILHPSFLSACSSGTQEAWITLISTLGLFFIIRFIRSGYSSFNLAGIFGWVILSGFTRWTLAVPAFLIFIIVLVPDLIRRYSNRTGSLPNLTVIALVCLGIAILVRVWWLSDLFHHEFINAWSGLHRFVHDPISPFIVNFHRVFQTFWAGFGWLTVPVPLFSMRLFVISSGLCLGVVFLNITLRDRTRQLMAGICFLVVIIFILLSFLRSAFISPAVQGRYIFPALPFLVFLITSGTSIAVHRFHSGFTRFVLIFTVSIWIMADISATLGGWYPYFHIQPKKMDPMVKTLDFLEWNPGIQSGLFIDVGCKAAHPFLKSGWYPEEGAAQVWFRREAEMQIPLLSKTDRTIRVKAVPFVPPSRTSNPLIISFNGQTLGKADLIPGWNVLEYHLPAGWICSGINWLNFNCPVENSPKSLGQSNDSRWLSAGIDTVLISSSIQNYNQGSYWAAADPGIIIHINPGDCLNLNTQCAVPIHGWFGLPPKNEETLQFPICPQLAACEILNPKYHEPFLSKVQDFYRSIIVFSNKFPRVPGGPAIFIFIFICNILFTTFIILFCFASFNQDHGV